MEQQLKRMTAERFMLLRQIETAELQVAQASRADHDVELLRVAVSSLEFDFINAAPARKRELMIRLVPGRGKYCLSFGPLSIDLHLVLPLKDSVKDGAGTGLSIDVDFRAPARNGIPARADAVVAIC